MRGLFLLLLLTNMALLTWQFVLFKVGQDVSSTAVIVPGVNEGLTLISELAAEQQPALRGVADEEVWAKPRKEELPPETISPNPNFEERTGEQEIGREDKRGEKDAVGAICLSLEDIESESTWQQLQHLLAGSGAKLMAQGEKQGTKTNYWVMLPPYSNRKKADEAAAILSGKKIKDFFIVRSGEYENAVSLGVFSGHERAKLRYEQITALKARLRRPRIEAIDLPAKRYFITFKVDDVATRISVASRLEALAYPPARKVICR